MGGFDSHVLPPNCFCKKTNLQENHFSRKSNRNKWESRGDCPGFRVYDFSILGFFYLFRILSNCDIPCISASLHLLLLPLT